MGLKCLGLVASPIAFMDYCQMGESTGHMALKTHCRSVAQSDNLASVSYLQEITRDDATKHVLQLLLDQHAADGMLGSLGCMHVG
jgi:hypothetical protein